MRDRLFTYDDVVQISSYARLDGAPMAAQIIADLDARGKLSGSPEPDPAAHRKEGRDGALRSKGRDS